MTNIKNIPAATLRRGMILANMGERAIITNIARGSVNTHATLANGRTLVIKHEHHVWAWI